MRIPNKDNARRKSTPIPHHNSNELLSTLFDGYVVCVSSLSGLEHVPSELLSVLDNVAVVDLLRLKNDFYQEGTGKPLDALMICESNHYSYVSIKLVEFNMITTAKALTNQFGQAELLLNKFDISAKMIIVLLNDERFEQNKSVLLRNLDNDVRRVFPMRIKDFCEKIFMEVC